MISRRFKIAVLVGGFVGAGIALGFSPAVRYAANRAAARYGAKLVVEQVVPTSRGVRLIGVNATLEDMPSARVRVDEVVVAYGASGRSVSFHGGVVSAIGPLATVAEQAKTWRSRHLAKQDGGSAPQAGGSRAADLSGIELRWQNTADKPTESLRVAGLRYSREGERFAVSARQLSATVGRTSVSIKNGRVELAKQAQGGYLLAGLSTDSVEAALTLPLGKGTSALRELGALAPSKPEASPPPTPAAKQSPGAALRSTLVGAARVVDGLLDRSAKVRLGGVHARMRHGADVLNLGPGTLEVARKEGRLVVELTPELRAAAPKPAGATPPGGGAAPADSKEETLTFRLAVPLQGNGSEASEEIIADVQGGPIWLSSLGVREGDFGLFDTSLTSLSTRSHLVLSRDGRTLQVDGEGKVHALSLRSAALSDEPVAGLELAFGLKGELDLDGSRARIRECELDLGAIRLVLHGDYDRARGATPAEDTHHFRGGFDVPLTACQSMLDSTPKGLVPKLQGMRLAGSFALRGQADIDTAHLDRRFRLDWDASSSCRVTEAPAAVHVDRFRKPFRRTAYDPKGRPFELSSGPGTADWVPGNSISKFMEAAVMTTEDGGFHRHRGFDHEAIKNSVRENLRKKKFVRGASTISMQLAKNLYLDRGKTLSRKLQEAVLTMYLEQELTKEQILELYLNVAELGPNVYGVGPAARAYFSTRPADLSLGQALYIATLLPSPQVQHFGSGGAVSPRWMAYLHKLMKIARDRHRVDDHDLEEGLRETVVRGSPTPQRSARAELGPIDPEAPDPPPPPLPAEEWR